jgi:hypothetical protein
VIAAQGVLAGNAPDEIAGIVAHFQPAEVPLTDGHLGSPVGWLAALLPEGANVWFTALIDSAAMAARVQRGPVPVSMEIGGLGVKPARDGHSVPFLAAAPAFRGNRFRPGWVLLAVAVVDQPARLGSALWLVS